MSTETSPTEISHAVADPAVETHVSEPGEHGAHPTDAKYIKIAMILAAITAVEVGVSYIKRLGAGGPPILLILAAIKFGMVAAYFMHLKFDHAWLRRVFLTGIILAAIVYSIVFLMFGVFQNRIHA
jgi:cytochrome c oxidase subunit IV